MSESAARPKIFYHYDPSEVLAILSAVLYGASLFYTLWQTYHKRSWVWIIMVVAVAMEFFGFVVRVGSANDISNRPLYIIQFVLIVLPPVLMAGAIYVTFGRVVFHVVPQHARTLRLIWISPRFVTPIFVTFDVVALLLQTAGAVMVTSGEVNKLSTGRDIAMAGISVQMIAFGLFTVIAGRFMFTSKRFASHVEKRVVVTPGEKRGSVDGCPRRIKPRWRMVLYAINVSCALIMIRSVYRMIEFGQGPTGSVHKKEWYMYVFDVIPMFIVCVSFNIVHPGDYLPFMGFRLPDGERKLPDSSDSGGTVELQREPLNA